jgi:hypothetical protein
VSLLARMLPNAPQGLASRTGLSMWTLLITAAYHEQGVCVEYLLKQGVDTEGRLSDGRTALYIGNLLQFVMFIII